MTDKISQSTLTSLQSLIDDFAADEQKNYSEAVSTATNQFYLKGMPVEGGKPQDLLKVENMLTAFKNLDEQFRDEAVRELSDKVMSNQPITGTELKDLTMKVARDFVQKINPKLVNLTLTQLSGLLSVLKEKTLSKLTSVKADDFPKLLPLLTEKQIADFVSKNTIELTEAQLQSATTDFNYHFIDSDEAVEIGYVNLKSNDPKVITQNLSLIDSKPISASTSVFDDACSDMRTMLSQDPNYLGGVKHYHGDPRTSNDQRTFLGYSYDAVFRWISGSAQTLKNKGFSFLSGVLNKVANLFAPNDLDVPLGKNETLTDYEKKFTQILMIKDLVIKWPYIEQGYLQGLETGENTLMYHTGLVGHAKLMISEGVDYTRENIDDALDIYANNAGLNPTWVATMRDSMSVDEKVSFFKSIKMIADCKTYIEEFKNKYQQAKQSGSLKDFFESAINETDACLPARTRTIADYRPKKQYSQADAVSIFNDTSKTHVSQQVYEYIKIVSGQEPSEVKLKWADYRDQIVDAIARSSSHNRLFGSAFTQQEVTSETIDEMLYDLKEYAMIEFSDVDYSDDKPVYRPQ